VQGIFHWWPLEGGSSEVLSAVLLGVGTRSRVDLPEGAGSAYVTLAAEPSMRPATPAAAD
jgi:hypothetical protein